MTILTRAAALVVVCLAAGAAWAQNSQVELPVSANMDIYRAGGYNDSSDGLAPAIYTFPARAGRTLTFASVSGSWTCSSSIAEFSADGTTNGLCFGSNIASPTGPFSGYQLTDFAGGMVGIFLENALPDSAPSPLRFYVSDASQGGIPTHFKRLSPSIGQVFFIGDGLTGTGNGSPQGFVVPATATHLYLGFLDACPATPTIPGCYNDNVGTVTTLFHLEDHVLDWVKPPLSTSSPSIRCCGAMAYDSASHLSLLFGGGNGGISPPIRFNDTWEFLNDGWHQVFPVTAPSPRQGSGIAYDASTGTTLLFGGGAGNSIVYNDTWIWDGVNWTEQFPAISPPGGDFDTQVLAYDAERQNVVLFDEGTTWIWDGRAKTWTEQLPASSPPTSNATIAYDEAHKNVVLFGGGTPQGVYLNQTWTWDGVTWTQHFPATSPSARSLPAMAYDAHIGRIVLFGGTAGPPQGLGDTWTWDGSTWTESKLPNEPGGRWAASLDFDPVSSELLLFGGEGTGDPFLNDTWLLRSVPVR